MFSKVSEDLSAIAHQVANSFRHTGQDPEELLGSAYIGVQKAMEVWKDGLAPFEAFAFLCGRTAVLDQLRQGGQVHREMKHLDPLDLDMSDHPPEPGLRETLTDMLTRAKVPRGDRIVCYLKWLDGFTLQEIAEREGMALWDVRSRLTRAKGAIERMVWPKAEEVG